MHIPDKEDFRKSQRFPFREDILIDGTTKCTSIDISEGGLYVSSIQHFQKESIITLSIPFRGENIMLKGKVQYFEPGIGIGIQFIELRDEQRALLQELIESIKKKFGV
jgi:hypothetical protein